MARLDTGSAAMKVLVSVAVFGLVPVPLRHEHDGDAHQAASEGARSLPLLRLPRPITERLATREELELIRDELLQISQQPEQQDSRSPLKR
jgi:hypothetical protein